MTYEYSLEGEAVKAWLKCHKETSQLVNSTSGTVVGRSPYQCGLQKVSGKFSFCKPGFFNTFMIAGVSPTKRSLCFEAKKFSFF